MTDRPYEGSELELFAEAHNWKAYVRAELAGWIGGAVLEVGAGLGTNARLLCTGEEPRWVCLEPDAALLAQVSEAIDAGRLPPCCEARAGTLADLPAEERFDTILYLDVLEHIEDDDGELAAAATRLNPGGRLVVLAPAHGWLYTAFDRAIGHHRRYTTDGLRRLTPPGLKLARLAYLDAAGMLASLGNRLLLRKALPSRGQIATWDKLLVPLSRRLDPVFNHALGKSVLAVWRASAL